MHSYGAFVEILPGKDGLLHISELDWKRIENVEDVLKEGDIVEVKLLDVDERTGKLKLSRRALLPKPEGYVEPERTERPPRERDDRRSNDRRDNRGGGNRGGDRRNNNRDKRD